MKQIIPILASVAVIGVVAVAFVQKNERPRGEPQGTSDAPAKVAGERASLTTTAPESTVSSGVSPVAPPPALPTVDSFAAKLAGQSMFVLDLFPRQLDELAMPALAWFGKVQQTKAWKKYQPEQMMAAGAEAAASANPGLAMLTSGGAIGIPPELREFWGSLSEISLSLAAKTIPIDAGGKKMAIPATAIMAKFASDEQAKKYSALIQMQVEPLKQQAEMMGAQISQPNPNTLDVSFPIPGSTDPVVASLTMKGSHFILLLGTKDPLDFFEKKSASASGAAQLVSRSWLSKTAIGGSMQFDLIMKLAKDLVAASLPEGQNTSAEMEQFEKMLAYLDGLGTGTLAFGSDGKTLRQNTCFQVDTKKPAGDFYGKIVEQQKVSIASRLIDERTIIAFDYPISALQQSAAMFKSQGLANLGSSPQEKKSLELFEKIYPLLEKFQFANLVGVVEAPPSGAMPRFGMLLTGSKLSGDVLLQQFTEAANELTTLAQTAQGGVAPTTPIASLVKSGSTSQIKFTTNSIPLVGQLAGQNSLVFGIDPYFLAGVTSKLDSAKSADFLVSKLPHAKEDITTGSQIFMMNLGLGLDMLKPFAGMAIPPGAGVTMEEIEEVSELFKVTMLATQRMQKVGDDVICTFASNYVY